MMSVSTRGTEQTAEGGVGGGAATEATDPLQLWHAGRDSQKKPEKPELLPTMAERKASLRNDLRVFRESRSPASERPLSGHHGSKPAE
jgi:hypothetical protein